MPSLITLYWRDIPAQVLAKKGRERARHALSDRFQLAIDRAAMRAKKIDADAYLDDWRRETAKVSGDMHLAVIDKAASIEASYDNARLEALIKNKGISPST